MGAPAVVHSALYVGTTDSNAVARIGDGSVVRTVVNEKMTFTTPEGPEDFFFTGDVDRKSGLLAGTGADAQSVSFAAFRRSPEVYRDFAGISLFGTFSFATPALRASFDRSANGGPMKDAYELVLAFEVDPTPTTGGLRGVPACVPGATSR
jgi:hypothetical protein